MSGLLRFSKVAERPASRLWGMPRTPSALMHSASARCLPDGFSAPTFWCDLRRGHGRCSLAARSSGTVLIPPGWRTGLAWEEELIADRGRDAQDRAAD
jgi:hypothetical protein